MLLLLGMVEEETLFGKIVGCGVTERFDVVEGAGEGTPGTDVVDVDVDVINCIGHVVTSTFILFDILVAIFVFMEADWLTTEGGMVLPPNDEGNILVSVLLLTGLF